MKHRRSLRVCSPMCAIMLALFVLRRWRFFRDSKYHAHERRNSVENRSQGLGGKIPCSCGVPGKRFSAPGINRPRDFLIRWAVCVFSNPCCSIHPHSQIERRDEIGWPSAPSLPANRRKVTNLLPRSSRQITPLIPTFMQTREQPV